MNSLDWITSVVAYSRGGGESNSITIIFTNAFGNYLGISIEKTIIIPFCVLAYWYMRQKWSKWNPILVFVLLVFGTFAGIGFMVTVAKNLVFLGV